MLRGGLSCASSVTRGCSHSILRSMNERELGVSFQLDDSKPRRRSNNLNNAAVFAGSASDLYGGPSGNMAPNDPVIPT